MKYLNKEHIYSLGIQWADLIEIIFKATQLISTNDYSQPIKPYLKYGNEKNRIIAMPAYLGGEFDIAGIKWISSFPDNTRINVPRANSITILNESKTGVPVAIIDTVLISVLRTVAVTGAIIKKFIDITQPEKLIKVGILGYGPIGQYHLDMINSMFSKVVCKIMVYDLNYEKKELISQNLTARTEWVNNWEEIYKQADILITCTVSNNPYIDQEPPKGSLQLNVSLRDYKAELVNYMDHIIVDNWEEVCRANTDIEMMHLKYDLQKNDTSNIYEALYGDVFVHKGEEDVFMFNPMGMAIFDVAVAGFYYALSCSKKIGKHL